MEQLICVDCSGTKSTYQITTNLGVETLCIPCVTKREILAEIESTEKKVFTRF